jgi:hypothetical protein
MLVRGLLLNYKTLIEAHNLFYEGEYRAFNYDGYMKLKKWQSWMNPDLPVDEIRKLFNFIKSWDRFFRGDVELFRGIYREICPSIQELKDERIEDTKFAEELKIKVRDVFDKTANCTGIGRYESTDASKILHTILPNFFVMWDVLIKENVVQGRERGAAYAFFFLPKMQVELREVIKTCMDERKLNRSDAIRHICEKCDGKTLAKLVDEYNYMKYTKKHLSL